MELIGHKKSVIQLSWDPTREDFLATASTDKSVRFWDARASNCVAVVETKGENINISYSRDGSMIIVGNKKDKLSWIDARTWKVLKEVDFHGETNEFGYDLDGKLFYATTGKGTVDIYQGNPVDDSFQKVRSLAAHAGACLSIAFAPNGKSFAVGSTDSLASIWDQEELICVDTISRFKSPLRTLCFSHDSQYIACGGEDGFIDISNASDVGKQVLSVKTPSFVNCVSWNPKSLILAYVPASTRSGSIYLLGP